ncbi:unnamed protein product [Camellia sinensis]
MPSSPKSFYARPSSSFSYSRRSTVLILYFLIGLTDFVFDFAAISRQPLGYKCRDDKPQSVSVVWERSSGGGNENGNGNGDQKRYKVMGFVGIQTGFDRCVRLGCRRIGKGFNG